MPQSRGADPPAGEQIPEQSDDPGSAPDGRGGVTIGEIARSEMDLAGLRAFLSLARVLHFGDTAAELGISQPALSQQISRLERRLGVQLFRRDSRNVALTEAGVVLANQAGGLLAHAERVIGSTVAAHRGQRTVLVVGFLGQAAGEATGQVVELFQQRYPAVELQFRALRFSEQLTALTDGTVDAALLRPPYGDEELSGITQVPLFDEPRVAVVAAAHRLAGKATCRFVDLENEVWVRHTSGVSPVWRAFWRLDDLRAGRPARLAPQSVDSVEEVLQQVGAGTAVALTHASVGRFYRRPTVAFVPVEGIQPSTLSVAWADHDGPFIAEFVSAATDATRPLRPRKPGTS